MGMFKELLHNLQNNEPSTMKLIEDISNEVEKERTGKKGMDILDDTDFTVCEEIVNGYLVEYMYRKKAAKIKGDRGQDKEVIFSEMKIISIAQFFTNEIVEDGDILKQINNELKKKINDKPF